MKTYLQNIFHLTVVIGGLVLLICLTFIGLNKLIDNDIEIDKKRLELKKEIIEVDNKEEQYWIDICSRGNLSPIVTDTFKSGRQITCK